MHLNLKVLTITVGALVVAWVRETQSMDLRCSQFGS